MRGFGGILACLGGVVAGACGHHTTADRPTATEVAATPATVGDASPFPERPPFVSPGERMSYRLSMHDMDVATYTVVVGEVTQLDGVDVVIVQAGVQSSPLVSMVKKVEDNFTSWIDLATSRPVLFRATELTPDQTDIETTDAELAGITDGTFAVTLTRPDQAAVVERQVVGDPRLFDFNGFLMELRGWTPPPGTLATADVLRSRYVWRTHVTMVGFEDVITDLGRLPAVRIDGESQRLGRDGQIDPKSDTRHYQLWVSDDADRVPLQLVARTDYGDLRMDIVEYLPGGDRVSP
jgi:hypothetical protein